MDPTSDEFGEWPLKRLLAEVCGSGPKSAEDLTYDQAVQAMGRIFAGEPDPTTLGAFWLATRWKRSSPEELAGYTDTMCKRVAYARPDADPVDCGANYDGKRESALLGVAAGAVAAAAGTPVVVHSGDRVPVAKGDAYKHVLDELGVRTELDPEESAAMVDETGFGFYYQPAFNPAVADLLDRRDRMGVRTFLNVVETLANPAGAAVHLGSFYHLAFARKVTETLERSRVHDLDRVVMFEGMEGSDDLHPGTTRIAEWDGTGEDPRFEDFEVETAAYGMDLESDDLAVGDVAADSARLTREVLAGEREDHVADAVALNAAVRIYARRDAADLDEGVSMAREALESGDAAAVLEALRSF
ncbi:MAG: anthranilate phosphoribosyltransferase [Haloferacaceae archaeon]